MRREGSVLVGIGGPSGRVRGRCYPGGRIGLKPVCRAGGPARTVDTPLIFQRSRTGYRTTVRLAVPDDT